MDASLDAIDGLWASEERQHARGRGPLHSGAVWEGVQRSGRNSYKVKVNIDTVDLERGTVTGLLQIQHLTPELDSLVTFFEGEIIKQKQDFKTARWGATDADDMKHWSRFPAFTRSLRQNLSRPTFSFKHENKPYLFMRWKEQFVVPSSQAQNIHGASFAGFYYLCLDMDCSGPDAMLLDSSARATSPPPRARVPSRSTSDLHRPRPVSTRAPSAQPQAGERIPAPAQVTGFDPPATLPTLSRGRSYAGTASASATQSPVPPRPRRASSATFSYAAAVRGTPSTPLPAHSDPSSATGLATPKEIEADLQALSLRDAASSPTESHPILIPPRGHTGARALEVSQSRRTEYFDLDGPSSPSSPPLSTSPFSLASSGGPRSPPSFLGSHGPILTHQPSTSPVTRAAGTRHSLDAILLGSSSQHGAPSSSSAQPFPSAAPRTRRAMSSSTASTVTTPCSQTLGQAKLTSHATMEHDPCRDFYGFNSYCQAKITGFYFFRHSEPYQELNLRYVPQTSRGGSAGFEFR
ncbi:hypothetical protein OIV83_001348 [Microbotryomycetes sp. JL201]|nr:hypothetical protein OIV83_001348 [Microbotryomycetes sp. JL201]